ncbi:cytochrome P450 87A3-like [Mercurialis annua]|uniref:cytochrome P450 87A3-like n=1 Tax=Mercurialis annua TaxID=3986 RepID=UPI00215E9043|nr:cytochrome P450 87A3-like [Mercurialis annua]
MVFITIIVVSLLVCIAHWAYSRRRNQRFNGKLPPGSMGLPFIGETIQFFTPYTKRDIPPFFKKRMDRYGSLFRTNIVGYEIVVSTDPEVNKFIFEQEGKSFISWYMDSFGNICGKDNFLFLYGDIHKYIRNLTLSILGVQGLKEKFLSEMEDLTSKQLELWSGQQSVELKEALSTMIFNLTTKKLFGSGEKNIAKLKQCYTAFIDGLISFPLNIPGTAYWKCIQGRKEAMKLISKMVDERRRNPNRQQKDFLDVIVEELSKNGKIITEKMALDVLFVLPFAFFESTSSAMVLAVEYLLENPKALEELTKEHESIISNRKSNESGITWQEFRSMTFTLKVINETARLANVVPGIFRKALKDVKLKEYTIPKGWMVMICPTTVHLNPVKYNDPCTFDPWRWKPEELHTGSKNFMVFGGGLRLCAGADFVKLQMAVFLHHLVTKYRWNVIKGQVVKKPGLVFPNGFHVQILKKNF